MQLEDETSELLTRKDLELSKRIKRLCKECESRNPLNKVILRQQIQQLEDELTQVSGETRVFLGKRLFHCKTILESREGEMSQRFTEITIEDTMQTAAESGKYS